MGRPCNHMSSEQIIQVRIIVLNVGTIVTLAGSREDIARLCQVWVARNGIGRHSVLLHRCTAIIMLLLFRARTIIIEGRAELFNRGLLPGKCGIAAATIVWGRRLIIVVLGAIGDVFMLLVTCCHSWGGRVLRLLGASHHGYLLVLFNPTGDLFLLFRDWRRMLTFLWFLDQCCCRACCNIVSYKSKMGSLLMRGGGGARALMDDHYK